MTGTVEPGNTGRRVAAAALAALVAVALAATARAAVPPSAGDILVTAIPRPVVDTTHGYVEYRFTVRNTSSEHTHRVTVALPGHSDYSGGLLGRVSRTALVGPNTEKTLSLVQLPLYMAGVDATVYVDGEKGEGVRLSIPSHGLGYHHADPDEIKRIILVSRGAPRVSHLFHSERFNLMTARDDVRSWSPNWLAYSCCDGIVVAGREVDLMPPGVRLALARYVECGGSLLVMGRPKRPLALAGGAGPVVAGGGYAAFGRRLVAPESGSTDAVTRFCGAANETYHPWEDLSDVLRAHERFPVVESINVPVRGMLALMLVFVIVIGPVNILVLARKRRRIWLFVTVPAASLVTCGLVFGYSIFSEGIRGRYRTLSLTVLDENVGRATTIGWTAFYSPLTPRSGLHFSLQTELTPQIYDYRDFVYSYRSPQDSGVHRTVSLAEDQHLAAGWVRARVPVAFKFRRSEDRRERLTVRRDADGPVRVVNGLGVPVRRLVLADEQGALHEAADVAPGAEATLASRQGRPHGQAFRTIYTRDWLGAARDLRRTPETYLRPGMYVAFLEESPFAEKALAGAVAQRCDAIVLGISKRSDDARSR